MKFRKLTSRIVKNKIVLLRVDYNVPFKKIRGKWQVYNDARIRATLPTIEFLLKNNCRIVIMSWLGRPKGQKVAGLKMDPVATKLQKLLHLPIKKLDNCVGAEVAGEITNLEKKEIILLENTRFHQEEEKASLQFAKSLVKGIDLIVFDAFAQSHRIHASTTEILKLRPSVVGFLLEKEIKMLSKLQSRIKRPYTVVLGGVKVSTRLSLIEHLLNKADCILIGGALASTFMKSQGISVGSSLVESGFVDIAKRRRKDPLYLAQDIIHKYGKEEVRIKGVGKIKKIQFPTDMVAVDALKGHFKKKNVDISLDTVLSKKWKFVDIGSATFEWYSHIIKKSHTVFFNGPLGYFEKLPFAKGTYNVMKSIDDVKGFTVAGGGDTVRFIEEFNMQGVFSHVSTGGGASLTFLSGKKMPVLEALKD